MLWSKNQVLKNQLESEPVTLGKKDILKVKKVVLHNENGNTFVCSSNVKGTRLGGSTVDLLNQLDGCKTKLNELYNDDFCAETPIIKFLRKVIKLYVYIKY